MSAICITLAYFQENKSSRLQHVEVWDGVAMNYRFINDQFWTFDALRRARSEGGPPHPNEAKKANSSYQSQSKKH